MAKPKKKVITERHTRATTRMPNKPHKVHLPAWVMLKYFPEEERVAHTVRINVYVDDEGNKGIEIIPLLQEELEGLKYHTPSQKLNPIRALEEEESEK